MKRLAITILFSSLFFVVSAQEFEGIERGDKELTFNGFVYTTVGQDYNYAFGTVLLSYGTYLSDKLVVGLAPGLSISTYQGEIGFDFSGQAFLNFNFSSTIRSFPFIRLSYYQSSFDVEYVEDLLMYASAQAGLGFKSFFC